MRHLDHGRHDLGGVLAHIVSVDHFVEGKGSGALDEALDLGTRVVFRFLRQHLEIHVGAQLLVLAHGGSVNANDLQAA